MTGLFNVFVSIFVLMYVGFGAWTAIIWMNTPPETVPKKSAKKAYYLYNHGKVFLYMLDATAVLGLVVIFVKWLSSNLSF